MVHECLQSSLVFVLVGQQVTAVPTGLHLPNIHSYIIFGALGWRCRMKFVMHPCVIFSVSTCSRPFSIVQLRLYMFRQRSVLSCNRTCTCLEKVVFYRAAARKPRSEKKCSITEQVLPVYHGLHTPLMVSEGERFVQFMVTSAVDPSPPPSPPWCSTPHRRLSRTWTTTASMFTCPVCATLS